MKFKQSLKLQKYGLLTWARVIKPAALWPGLTWIQQISKDGLNPAGREFKLFTALLKCKTP